MLDSERRAWLRLARTENVGPVTFRNLVARFGTASAALEEVPRLAARGGSKNFLLPDEGDIARELDALAKQGGRMIAACETDYPQGLKALEAPPPVISVLGHPHLFQREMIAIALSSAYFLLFHRETYAALALPRSLLIYYMHRDNIRRLLRGEEPRIGAKSSAK